MSQTQVAWFNRKFSAFVGALPKDLPSWNKVHNEALSYESLLVAGFTKKFEDPANGNQAVLAEKAWKDFCAFDESLPRFAGFGPGEPNPPSIYGTEWDRIRDRISDWLENFFYLDYADAWPGPGENDESLRGWVFPTMKFSTEWTVTDNCLEFGRKVVLSNRYLRRYLAENGTLPDRPGRLDAEYLLRVQRSEGVRFSTVDHSTKKRRPIGMEPFINQLCQRVIGRGLRRVYSKVTGYALEHAAALHARLIMDLRNRTLDASNASSSVYLELLYYLVPEWFFRLIWQARSPRATYRGESIALQQVATMGCYFTFELLTLVLLAIVREYDERGSTFGDDVICSAEAYPHVVKRMQEASFVVNEDKSCPDVMHAESCGAFRIGIAAVERYDFRWATNVPEVFANLNKIMRLTQNHMVPEHIRVPLMELWTEALRVFDVSHRGWVAVQPQSAYIEIPVNRQHLLPKPTPFARHHGARLCYPEPFVVATKAWVFVPARKTRHHFKARDRIPAMVRLRNLSPENFRPRGEGVWRVSTVLTLRNVGILGTRRDLG